MQEIQIESDRYSTYQYLVSGWFCLAEFAGAARVHPEESAASEAVLMQTAGRSWGTSPVAVAEDPGTQWSPMEPNGAQWTPMESDNLQKRSLFSGKNMFLDDFANPSCRWMNLKAFRFGFGWPLRMRAQRLTEVCPGPYIWVSPGPGSVVVCLFFFTSGMSTNSNQLNVLFGRGSQIGHGVLLMRWHPILQPISAEQLGMSLLARWNRCRIGDIFVNAVASLAAEEPPTRSGGWANETDGPPESRPSDELVRFAICRGQNFAKPRGSGCRMVT